MQKYAERNMSALKRIVSPETDLCLVTCYTKADNDM